MEQELISSIMQSLDSEIVHSYCKEKNQVMLCINSKLFNKVANEMDN